MHQSIGKNLHLFLPVVNYLEKENREIIYINGSSP
jgi:hypothetical protein